MSFFHETCNRYHVGERDVLAGWVRDGRFKALPPGHKPGEWAFEPGWVQVTEPCLESRHR